MTAASMIDKVLAAVHKSVHGRHFSDMPNAVSDVQVRGRSGRTDNADRSCILTLAEVVGFKGERHKPWYRSVILTLN